MKHIKLYEEFLADRENLSVNEFNLNLFGKFKKFFLAKKEDGDKEFLDDVMIINPDTGKHIQLSSALSYDKESKIRKIADAAMKELKDNITDSKNISPDQKAKYLFNKEIKQQKAQAKEWGEEWTDNDTDRVKAEVHTSVYSSMPSGKKRNDYLKKVLEDPTDNALMYLSKHVDNDGAEIMYKSIDVNEYLQDESGKGQNITQTVLRSKSATPEERKKALMYDWVASSSSAGSLMMSKHLIDRLKMGEDSKKGFEHRLSNGETFEDKPGGKLQPDIEKENIKAVDDIYNKTQEYYKSKGIKTIKVYRGSDDKNPDAYFNPIESWTTDKEVAAQYGQYVHSKEIPVERVLMGHFDKDFPDPYDSNGNPSKEIVILGK